MDSQLTTKMHDLHEKLMQTLIDVINNDEELKNEVTNATHKGVINFSMDVNALEHSLEFGQWHPGTDSSISLAYNNYVFLYNM